jgi:hypothetical protein
MPRREAVGGRRNINDETNGYVQSCGQFMAFSPASQIPFPQTAP